MNDLAPGDADCFKYPTSAANRPQAMAFIGSATGIFGSDGILRGETRPDSRVMRS